MDICTENGLENRLKQKFNEMSVLLKTDAWQWNEFAYKTRKHGLDLYLNGHYSEAKKALTQSLEHLTDKQDKITALKILIDCCKEKFDHSKDENDFGTVCESYEKLISLDPKPEHYNDYIDYLVYGLVNEHNVSLLSEGTKLADIALSKYPSDAELNANMFFVYKIAGEKQKALETILRTCKMRYKDPEYLFIKFGLYLWDKIGDDKKKSIPFHEIMLDKNKAVWHDPDLLVRYGQLILEYVNHYELLNLKMFIQAFELDKSNVSVLNLVKEAYNKAMRNVKDKEKLKKIGAVFENFCNKYNLNFDAKQGDDELLNHSFDMALKKDNGNLVPVTVVKKRTKPPRIRIFTPKEIKRNLDDYVIGQDSAKQEAAIGLYKHLLLLDHWFKHGKKPTARKHKSNILFIGPTGCGKTYIAEKLAEILQHSLGLDLPFVIYDTSKVTEAGYVGENASDCIKMLYLASGQDLKKTEIGIIYLDELDKKRGNSGSGKDVSGEGAQNQYLKLLEGSVVNVELDRGKTVQIDTSNILFMAGGAFADSQSEASLSHRIKKRKSGGIGFSRNNVKQPETSLLDEVTDEDLVSYGLSAQFVARFHSIAALQQLSARDLRRILTEPKEALIPHFEWLFRSSGVKLNVTGQALDLISEAAFKLKSGARGLDRICNKVFKDALYNLPGTGVEEVKIDRCYVAKVLKKMGLAD